MMLALIEDSEQGGLPFGPDGPDYRAPVGVQVKDAAFVRQGGRPWLGELRVDERTPKRKSRLGDAAEYRLYFGEPDSPETAVLGLSVGVKRGRDRRATDKQTQQMINAMWKLIKWCDRRKPRIGWRKWHESR